MLGVWIRSAAVLKVCSTYAYDIHTVYNFRELMHYHCAKLLNTINLVQVSVIE